MGGKLRLCGFFLQFAGVNHSFHHSFELLVGSKIKPAPRLDGNESTVGEKQGYFASFSSGKNCFGIYLFPHAGGAHLDLKVVHHVKRTNLTLNGGNNYAWGNFFAMQRMNQTNS